MIEIGMVGIDSSHPAAFADVFSAGEEATVSAVWDQGDVRDPDEVEAFCTKYGATNYDELSEMVDAIDAVMILSVNWETHVEQASPFLRAGVPTFIDKPVVGNLADLETLAETVGDTPLFGGSSIPFHPDIAEYPIGIPGRTLAGAGYNDPFYYGGHIIDTMRTFAGASWTSVSKVEGPGQCATIQFSNETNAMIRLAEPTDDAAFAFLDVSDATRATRMGMGDGRAEEMYARLMDAWIDVIRGDRQDTSRVLDVARLQLAVQAALDSGSVIHPDSPEIGDVNKDGQAFLEDYRS